MSSSSNSSSSAYEDDQREQPKSFNDYVIDLESTRCYPKKIVEAPLSDDEVESEESSDDDNYKDGDSDGFDCEDKEHELEEETENLKSPIVVIPWFEREKEPNVKDEQPTWIEQDEKTYKANMARVERLRELAREKIDMVMKINNRFKSLDELVSNNQAVMQMSGLLQQTTRGMESIANDASQFGIGSEISTQPTRKTSPSIPPVGLLPACPPPVSRRDVTSSNQSSSSRRSRF